MVERAEERQITLSLTKEDAFSLALWIEMGLFDEIRNNVDVDNIDWVHNWIHIISALDNLYKVDRRD